MKVLIKVHTAVQIRWSQKSSKLRDVQPPLHPPGVSFFLINFLVRI